MASKTYAVIVAGGTGTRMGQDIPKQFLDVNGKSVVEHTLQAFHSALPEIELILVAHPDHFDQSKTIAAKFNTQIPVRVVAGGSTRFHSVKNGLMFIENTNSIVFVHDAARCLVSTRLILQCLQAAEKNGNAIPAITISESVRMISGDESSPVKREHLRLIQTPQTFRTAILLAAYNQVEGDQFTDDASVLEAGGGSIHLVEGERTNIKITYPIDLQFASVILGQTATH